MGIPTPVYHTADAAFSMDLIRTGETLLDVFSARDTLQEDTTISVSGREWRHTAEDTSVSDYVRTTADVADWLVEVKDSNVVFQPTCTGLASYHRDDRLMAARVVDLINQENRDQARILKNEYTPRQRVKVYRQMDLHIGMRMHSNILAMMAETPVVAIQ